MNPLLVIFGLAAAIAIALISISLLLARLLLRRSAKRNLIRVKPLGIFLGIAQFLIAFIVIAWGVGSIPSRFWAALLPPILALLLLSSWRVWLAAPFQQYYSVMALFSTTVCNPVANYSLKRTAATACGILTPIAAAAA